jgi:hypothetical protein
MPNVFWEINVQLPVWLKMADHSEILENKKYSKVLGILKSKLTLIN